MTKHGSDPLEEDLQTDPDLEAEAADSEIGKRHRPVSHFATSHESHERHESASSGGAGLTTPPAAFPTTSLAASFVVSRDGFHGAQVPADRVSTGTLPDDVRAYLWDVVNLFLFTANSGFDPWTGGVSGRPAVRRVWSAAPLSGDPENVPDDVAEMIEGWFSLVEAGDIYAFVQSVHDNLELPSRARFAASCNVALERACSDHRFVFQKLVPIAARADITSIERALTACSTNGFDVPHAVLLDALGRLGAQPDPDFRGAIQEAVRAVEEAAFMLTGERHLTLEEALDDLKEKGLVDAALEAAHRGLFTYASASTRRTTADDARLIVVMCAGFISHLATRDRA
jgi:hypothetical protein